MLAHRFTACYAALVTGLLCLALASRTDWLLDTARWAANACGADLWPVGVAEYYRQGGDWGDRARWLAWQDQYLAGKLAGAAMTVAAGMGLFFVGSGLVGTLVQVRVLSLCPHGGCGWCRSRRARAKRAAMREHNRRVMDPER